VSFVATPNGQYLEVQVFMKAKEEVSPVLYDLTIGGGCGKQPDCWFITQQTDISLFCTDQDPHPVGNATLFYRFRVAETCDELENSDWTDWIDPLVINFEEDSCHELEYYCIDGLGNTQPVQTEIDIVDTVPPVITTSIVGPYLGECPGILRNSDGLDGIGGCFIDGVTKIHVEAVDPEPHPVNDVRCSWDYTVTGGEKNGTGQENITAPFDINFPEESNHELTITCWDALGNSVRKVERYVVDKSAPKTSVDLVGPLYINQTSGETWINNLTEILLSAVDPEPHPSGVKAVWYRNTMVDESYCKSQDICQQAEGSGEFELYTSAKYKNEESCHLIEYYSVDNVEKTERVNKKCVYVDMTPPTPEKTVGEPKKVWDGKDSTFYKEETAHCWDGTANAIDCWKVTMGTPITFNCNDPRPHPVDHNTACFNVDFDGEGITDEYCSKLNGEMTEGYCCLTQQRTPATIYFNEESEHDLKFYCEDALGNKGPVDDEKFKVEGTIFKIKINKKWNLVSVPFVLTDNNITRVFESIADNIESVWTYDLTSPVKFK
jgi:hypothetical protein